MILTVRYRLSAGYNTALPSEKSKTVQLFFSKLYNHIHSILILRVYNKFTDLQMVDLLFEKEKSQDEKDPRY